EERVEPRAAHEPPPAPLDRHEGSVLHAAEHGLVADAEVAGDLAQGQDFGVVGGADGGGGAAHDARRSGSSTGVAICSTGTSRASARPRATSCRTLRPFCAYLYVE